MRKKLIVVSCAMGIFCVTMLFMVSCTKKNNRLVSDTLTIGISPASVAVSTGTTKSLTATCKSANSNNADISPQWTVDSPSLGAFNPSKGKTTTFTASATAVGTGKIYATYSNISANVNVSVSSGIVNTISNSTPTVTSISIDHTSISVSTGATSALLTATCTDANGHTVNVVPTWTYPPSLGTLSATQAHSVTFTAGASVGNGTIKASYSGVDSNLVSVSVSSAALNTSIYGLYSTTYGPGSAYTHMSFTSANPPDGGVIITDPGWTGTLTTGSPFDSNSPLETEDLVCTAKGFHIQFGNSSQQIPKDMNGFSAGYLKFDIKNSDIGDNMTIRIVSYDPINLDNNTYEYTSYTSANPNWNSVTIPLSYFSLISNGSGALFDFTQVVIPAQFLQPDRHTFYITNVRWDKSQF